MTMIQPTDRLKTIPAALAAGLFLLLAGCGGNPAQLETAPVSGRVTLDGEPVSTGVVIFTPEQGRAGRAELASDGTYTVGTYGRADGAVVGSHRVAVVAQEGAETGFVEDAAPVWLVPPHYANPNTSHLEFEVRPDVHNRADFALSSQPP